MSQIWVSNTRDCLSSRFLFSIYGLALIWLSRKVTTQAKANVLASLIEEEKDEYEVSKAIENKLIRF